jgi:hypothetical protein
MHSNCVNNIWSHELKNMRSQLSPTYENVKSLKLTHPSNECRAGRGDWVGHDLHPASETSIAAAAALGY